MDKYDKRQMCIEEYKANINLKFEKFLTMGTDLQ